MVIYSSKTSHIIQTDDQYYELWRSSGHVYLFIGTTLLRSIDGQLSVSGNAKLIVVLDRDWEEIINNPLAFLTEHRL